MNSKITSDNTPTKELLRLIRLLDPTAVVASQGASYYLKSDVRRVDFGRDLIELARPIEPTTSTAADAVRLWWDFAVTDLSPAAYLAFAGRFYRFNHLSFWEPLDDQTVQALDEVRSDVMREEFGRAREQEAAEQLLLVDRVRSRSVHVPRDEQQRCTPWESRKAGLILGAALGVLWGLTDRTGRRGE